MTAREKRDRARLAEVAAAQYVAAGDIPRARHAITVASALRRAAWASQPSTRLPAALNALGLYEPRYGAL